MERLIIFSYAVACCTVVHALHVIYFFINPVRMNDTSDSGNYVCVAQEIDASSLSALLSLVRTKCLRNKTEAKGKTFTWWAKYV